MPLADLIRRRKKPVAGAPLSDPLDPIIQGQKQEQPQKTPLGQDVPPVKTGVEPEMQGPEEKLLENLQPKPDDTGTTPDKDIDILGGLGPDISKQIQDYIQNLLSGGGMGAFDAASNEALARQAQHMRGRAGAQLGGLIGQGAAQKGAQATETDILGSLAEGQLQSNLMAQQMKGEGAAIGVDLAKATERARLQQEGIDLQKSQIEYDKKIDAMNNLLSMGGEENIGEYADMFKDMFGIEIDPQRFLDKESQQDFSDGMSRISQYISSGMDWEDALNAMKQDGTLDMLGMDESEIHALYEKMQLNTNPVYQMMNSLTDDMISQWFPDMEPDEARSMIGKLALFGGMTMNEDGTFSIDQEIFDKLFGGDDDPDPDPDITGPEVISDEEWNKMTGQEQSDHFMGTLPDTEEEWDYNKWKKEGSPKTYDEWLKSKPVEDITGDILKGDDSLDMSTDQINRIIDGIKQGNQDLIDKYSIPETSRLTDYFINQEQRFESKEDMSDVMDEYNANRGKIITLPSGESVVVVSSRMRGKKMKRLFVTVMDPVTGKRKEVYIGKGVNL